MFKLKSCPRCNGDVVIDRDIHGWYELCLQCGYERDLPGLAKPAPVASKPQKGTK